MSVGILLLSDIHLKAGANPVQSKAEALVRAVTEQLRTLEGIIVLVAGDVAFSGKEEEYAVAERFLSSVKEGLQAEARVSVAVVVCPGNHDCNFSLDNAGRQNNVAAVVNGGMVDQSVIDSCTSIQASYLGFRDRVSVRAEFSDKLLSRYQLIFGGAKLEVVTLNASWVSKLREDTTLAFPFKNYEIQLGDLTIPRIMMLHHPFNWFHSAVHREFRRFIRRSSNLIVTGHEHEGNVGVIDDQESGRSTYIESRVLQESDKGLTGTGFFFIVAELSEGSFESTPYRFENGEYVAEKDQKLGLRRVLSPKDSLGFELTADFVQTLDDPGAVFMPRMGANLRLSDIYVYPDMHQVQGEGKLRSFLDASELLNITTLEGGIILQGEEKWGSTSLLYQLFGEYLSAGYAPILIRGSDIRRTAGDEVQKIARRATLQQYEEKSAARVNNAPRNTRVLLVDNFDHTPIVSEGARARIVADMLENFDYVILVVGKGFELKELTDSELSSSFEKLRHFHLQPFGFAKRAKLVQKWVSLTSSGGQTTEAEFIGKCDRAEKLMASAMNKSFIPSAPLYLVTLLQSVEDGRAAELRESSLGYYYQYLITQGFGAAGVPADKLTVYFQFITQLAWKLHQSGTDHLTRSEFKAFSEQFSKTWTTVEFDSMVRKLQDAKVLIEAGGAYRFRYPYIYYYLKGKYMSENISDAAIVEYVRACCSHLYVRENANTVLFLAHHTSHSLLLRSISGSLNSLFSGMKATTFAGDIGDMTGLISAAPELAFRGGSTLENRARVNRVKDEDERGDGLHDLPEASPELSLSAQLTMLFKTVEIIGQLLKNQYATIQRPVKEDLIRQLFEGPLRALSNFYAIFDGVPESLIAAVGSAIERKRSGISAEQRDAVARQTVAEAIQLVTVGLLSHPAKAVSSDDLVEEIEDVVEQGATTAYRLIDLAIRLDRSGDIPRAQIERIWRDSSSDILVSRVVKILVLNRLYMFKTSESDMRWINSTLNMSLSAQRSINYLQAGKKVG